MNAMIDVREVLPVINVPTLILHRQGDRAVEVEHSRYLAAHIRNSKLVELNGDDHLWWVGNSVRIVSEIQEFLTGERGGIEQDRVLATVLFTDIVNSTR
jgi:pimeloyl-ACP methyl ester carboxylesterase